MKLLLSLLLILASNFAIATPGIPVFTSGGFARTFLPLNISNQCYLITGTADPSSSATNGPECSLYLSTNGKAYMKQDAGSSTNWTQLAAASGGVTAVINGGTGKTSWTTNALIYADGATSVTSAGVGTSGQVMQSNGSGQAPAMSTLPGNTNILKAPTMQKFTSGSGTYTLPTSPSPIYIVVRAIGGGGGGGGSGTAATSGNTGGSGGNTTFGTSLIVANGGSGGASYNIGDGGTGGSASLGSGPAGDNIQGGDGQTGFLATVSTVDFAGGQGGSSCLGGGGAGRAAAGSAGKTTSGGGGGGAGIAGVISGAAGGGGGSGGCVLATILTPSATYSYAVGAAGAAGTAATSGFAGGAGGTGELIVYEYYQ